MFVEIILGFIISTYSVYITIPGHFNPGTTLGLNSLLGISDIETTILFFLAIIATFEQALFA